VLQFERDSEVCLLFISGNQSIHWRAGSQLIPTHVHFPDGHAQLAPQEQEHPGAVIKVSVRP